MTATLAWFLVVTIVTFFTLIAVVALFVTRRKQEEAKLRADVQTRLLDRFGSAKEFVDFLQSDSGSKFLGAEPVDHSIQWRRLLAWLRNGTIGVLLGVAFLIMAFWMNDEGFAVPGLILIAIGLGYLISTGVSWRLATRWGLLPTSGNSNERTLAATDRSAEQI